MPRYPASVEPGRILLRPAITSDQQTGPSPPALGRDRRTETAAARHNQRYGRAHRKLRALWLPKVEAGQVTCWRCGQRIRPGEPWDLGHEDTGETHAGPEHANRCNRSAGGRAGAAITNTRAVANAATIREW